jgi:hypothetical protein
LPSEAPALPSVDQRMPTIEFNPNHEHFPLLLEPDTYMPDTLDIYSDRGELDHWVGVLISQIDSVVDKAVAGDKDPNNPGAVPLAEARDAKLGDPRERADEQRNPNNIPLRGFHRAKHEDGAERYPNNTPLWGFSREKREGGAERNPKNTPP